MKKLSERSRLAIAKQMDKEINRLKVTQMAVIMGIPIYKKSQRSGNDYYAEIRKSVNQLEKIANRLWAH